MLFLIRSAQYSYEYHGSTHGSPCPVRHAFDPPRSNLRGFRVPGGGIDVKEMRPVTETHPPLRTELRPAAARAERPSAPESSLAPRASHRASAPRPLPGGAAGAQGLRSLHGDPGSPVA